VDAVERHEVMIGNRRGRRRRSGLLRHRPELSFVAGPW
jgi:hypothetical protein